MGDQYRKVTNLYKTSRMILQGISKNGLVIISGPLFTGINLYLHISLHTLHTCHIIVSSTR